MHDSQKNGQKAEDNLQTFTGASGIFSPQEISKSPLKVQQQSWIDPLEPAIQDTFYDREIKQSRPDFQSVETINTNTEPELEQIFDDKSNKKNQVPTYDDTNDQSSDANTKTEMSTGVAKAKKFGAWDGVFVGCILNIFGVIMFLRVGWMVGQAGIVNAILIILISSMVTFLTTLSMSAICTNGTILSGGAYYIISRSLGPAIGGSVGLMFSLGNMVAVSLYLIGFAETLVQNLGSPILTGDTINDIRIWSNVVLVFELILALIGLKYVVKANMGLLLFIILTIIAFFAGSVYRTAYNDSGEQTVYGSEGWVNGNVIKNLGASYTDNYNFWGVLSVFFPAVTGIMAGANISGDLRNPSEDIPRGTLVAVLSSTMIYCLMALFVGAVTARSELLSNFLVMADIAVVDVIVLIGVYAATLSSGIAALVGAPRILQAVAQDNVIDLPIVRFFSVTDEDGNPVRGYFLSFLVAAGCNCIGELNFVAPLISEFFMIAYLMINFSCFAMDISKTPNWRPSFKYFHRYGALLGFLLCFTVMFLVDYVYAIVTIIIGLGIYYYIYIKDPSVEWGSAQASRSYYQINKSLLRLRHAKTHIKNWRPNILCLVKKIPSSIDSDDSAVLAAKNSDLPLVYFVQTLRKSYGSIFFGSVVVRDDNNDNVSKFIEYVRESNHDGYLPKYLKNCEGFYQLVFSETVRRGACNLFQLCGLGHLQPNTLMLGFLNKWKDNDKATNDQYVDLLRDALTLRMGVVIVCQGFEKISWTSVINRMPTTLKPALPILNNNVQEKEEGIIDVWWMMDDGGLTMLLPHLMKQDAFWKNCKLRMNVVVDKSEMLQIGMTDHDKVQSLISKFRLSFEKEARIIYVENSKPRAETKEMYHALLKDENITIEDLPRPEVARRWLRLSELLIEHSKECKAVVVTLPLPSATFNSKAYLALLHCIANQNEMPPMLIMRGNGETSITFYSD